MKSRLIILLIALASAVAARGTTEVDIDSLRYVLNDDGSATVKSCLYQGTPDITIPQTITSGGTTYTVKQIADYAFDNRSFITSVTFPNTLEQMGYCSFRWCKQLTSLNIPASLKAFSSSNFSECTSLQTVTIAAGSQMTKVDEAAFYNCNQLTTINLPNTITEIGQNAFIYCKSLQSINLPSLTKLGNSAFKSCEALQSITLPSSLTDMGREVFVDCRALQTVNNFETLTLTSVPYATFLRCYSLTSITLPSTVTSIADYGFSECKALTSIAIPSSVTSIGYRGFYYCESLQSITLPSSLTTLGQDAFAYCKSMQAVNNFEHTQLTTTDRAVFYGCESLQSITLPPTLKHLGNEAFNYCKSLTTVNLSSLETAGEYVFANCGLTSLTVPNTMTTLPRDFVSYCDSLRTVTLPEGLTTIARGVFYEDDALTTINMPSTLTSIGTYAFANCKSLPSITIPANVTVIDEYAFQYCTSLATVDMQPATMTTLGRNAFDVCESLTSFRVPEGITSLGQSTFWGCTSLQSLELPSTLTTIALRVCYHCSSLTSIDIPSGVTSIGDDAFNGCKQLNKIILPPSLTSLGNYAFAYCDSVKSVTFLGNNDVTLTGESHFSSLKKLKSVKLPDGLTLITRSMFYGCEQLETIDLSRTHVAEIRPYAFYNNKVLTAVQFPTTLTTIGEQAFYNNNIRHLQLPDRLQTIGNFTFAESKDLSAAPVLLPQSLTSIGEHAFYNCNRLAAVTFHPLSSLSLGGYIFDDCDSLRAVHFPNDLPTIPRATYSSCKQLHIVTLPANLQTVEPYAFYNTLSLDSLVLPSTVKTVGEEAYHYSMLPSLTLPEGLETIGRNAFRECDRLKEVTLPSTLKTLGHAAFWTCDSLRTITFAQNLPQFTFSGDSHFGHCAQLVKVTLPRTGLTTITAHMFRECPRLRNIELPGTLTSIGDNAFYGCDSLQTIYIPDNVTSIGNDAFEYCRGLHYVRLPEGLETIGNGSFAYCEKLPYINIPSTVTSIGNYALHTTATHANSNFKSVGIMGNTMPVTKDHVFWQYQPSFSLLVPSGQETDYQNSSSWTPDVNDNRTIIGYPATKQPLTQDLIHLSMLDRETYHSGSPEAVYVDWFEGMGNYRVFYTDAHGHRTTALPAAGGDYTISLEFEEGPYYLPATFNEVGTLTIQEIADEDFALLWDFYSKTYDWTRQKSTWTGNGGGGAKANWQLIEGVKESAAGIFGVKWNNGHVQEINFGTGSSIYNLNGNETPVSLFALPQVKKIEIANAELYGNISDKVEEWLASGNTLSPTLEYLDLQRNKLEGNISTLANALPALKTLDVHDNRFSTVWPALSETLENVNISNQTITDIVATVDLRDMTDAGFFSTLPSIVFYDPDTRAYANNIKIGVQSQTNWSSFTVNYNGSADFTVTGNCLWKGASGDIAKCSYTDSKNKTTNFNATFFYDMGDVDFNGAINVSDLQQSINYLFRDGYGDYSRYNFTAGDLNADNSINVLDVVQQVDLLLTHDIPTGAHSKGNPQSSILNSQSSIFNASLYCRDGKLILNTAQPIAALDIVLTSPSFMETTRMAVGQHTQDDGQLHLVIYDISGKTLPTGETVLGNVADGSTISHAMLVDEDAQNIRVALNNPEVQLLTGIENNVQCSMVNGQSTYDLQGRKVNPQSSMVNGQLPKGILIVNGKKVIIK
ncbi:MAG: leucine-rich repeat protein [Bacteroidaceae bacterium]|nr:leucine-rich repeat protein [Bacteroidaceae bacterium]